MACARLPAARLRSRTRVRVAPPAAWIRRPVVAIRFIFVVGLDEDVIHQAVRAKFATAVTGRTAADGQGDGLAAATDEELGRATRRRSFRFPTRCP